MTLNVGTTYRLYLIIISENALIKKSLVMVCPNILCKTKKIAMFLSGISTTFFTYSTKVLSEFYKMDAWLKFDSEPFITLDISSANYFSSRI